MAMSMRRQPHKAKRERGKIYIPVAFLIICAAMLFAMTVFFRVSTIEVTGNERYTDEEVITASGIEAGDNLFFINRFTAVSRLFSRLPYVEIVTVTRYLPGKIVIDVSECVSIAYVSVESQPWVIDRNGKILAQATKEECASLIRIDGLSPTDPTIGEKMVVSGDDELKLDYMADILDQIQKRGLQESVSYVDMTELSNPTMMYLDRFYVQFGANDGNTEYKFGKLVSSVEQLTDGDTGTIDLSSGDAQVIFSPE